MSSEEGIEGATILLQVAEDLYDGDLSGVEEALRARLASPPTIHRLSRTIERDLETIEKIKRARGAQTAIESPGHDSDRGDDPMGKKDKTKPNLTITIKGGPKTGKTVLGHGLTKHLVYLGFDVDVEGLDPVTPGMDSVELVRLLAGKGKVRVREKTKKPK